MLFATFPSVLLLTNNIRRCIKLHPKVSCSSIQPIWQISPPFAAVSALAAVKLLQVLVFAAKPLLQTFLLQ
jgi:hypothetical protein